MVPNPVLGEALSFVAAFGNQVQELIRRIDSIDSTSVCGVGVKNPAVFILIKVPASARPILGAGE
jgi:hypothetical protein